jgi:hypothetical protein
VRVLAGTDLSEMFGIEMASLPEAESHKLWEEIGTDPLGGLIWDVFAVLTYFTVSLLFWYVGLIPDFATLRDRSTSRVGRVIYGILAMGWRLVETYADAALSGASRHRPSFQALVADARQKKFDIVVCEAVDRLERQIGHRHRVLHKPHRRPGARIRRGRGRRPGSGKGDGSGPRRSRSRSSALSRRGRSAAKSNGHIFIAVMPCSSRECASSSARLRKASRSFRLKRR